MKTNSEIQNTLEEIKTILTEIAEVKDQADYLEIERKHRKLEELFSQLFVHNSYELKRCEQNEEMANRIFKDKKLSVLVGDITALGKTIAKVVTAALSIIGGGAIILSPIQAFQAANLANLGKGINALSKGTEGVSGIVDSANQGDQTRSQYFFEGSKKRGDDLSQQEKESGSRQSRTEQQAHDLEQGRHRAVEAIIGG